MKNKPRKETRYLFLDQNSHWWFVSDKEKAKSEKETKIIFKSNWELILPMAILLGSSIALSILMAIRLT